MSPRRSLPTSNGLVLVLPKCILVAALSLPTRCSTLQRYSRESGNVFYEVTRSLRTSAAEISVLARVLTSAGGQFCQDFARGRTALTFAFPHLFGLKIVLQSCYDHRLQCTP